MKSVFSQNEQEKGTFLKNEKINFKCITHVEIFA